MADPNVSDAEADSRTASVPRGKRAFHSGPASNSTFNSSPRSPSKHRKSSLKKSQDLEDAVPMGFSQSLPLPETGDPPTNARSPSPTTNDASAVGKGDSPSGLGKNRLAAGFRPTADVAASATHFRTSSYSSAETGASKEDAIEIEDSDEEMGSDGGMIVNLDDSGKADSAPDADHDEVILSSDEEAEAGRSPIQFNEAELQIPGNSSESLAPVRLVNLNPDELEDQLRYAFYHLDRNQIDLNRLVVCLVCFGEGHKTIDCPKTGCGSCSGRHLHSGSLCPNKVKCTKCRERGHDATSCPSDLTNTTVPCDLCGSCSHVEQDCSQRFFVQTQPSAGSVKLWISCSSCASKDHLVGDCPDTLPSASTRWSLKTLNSAQITNLGHETGARQREKDAENKGMRPSGLKIRGRAGIHQAGVPKSSSVAEDEDDNFLRPSVRRQDNQVRPQVRLGQNSAPEDRYDRFEASYHPRRPSPRDHGGWYATDSFGRRRSRSPRPELPMGDRWRPDDRRPPSPRRFDRMHQQNRSSGPKPSRWPPWEPRDYRHQQTSSIRPPNSRYPLRSNSDASTGPPPSNIRVQLPTRQGSNPNLKSTSDTANKGGPHGHPSAPEKQTPSKKNRKRGKSQTPKKS